MHEKDDHDLGHLLQDDEDKNNRGRRRYNNNNNINNNNNNKRPNNNNLNNNQNKIQPVKVTKEKTTDKDGNTISTITRYNPNTKITTKLITVKNKNGQVIKEEKIIINNNEHNNNRNDNDNRHNNRNNNNRNDNDNRHNNRNNNNNNRNNNNYNNRNNNNNNNRNNNNNNNNRNNNNFNNRNNNNNNNRNNGIPFDNFFDFLNFFNNNRNNIIGHLVGQNNFSSHRQGVTENIIEILPEININLDHLDDEKKNCTICFDEFINNEKGLVLPCLHIFHPKCIKKWFLNANTCPTCKFEMTQENIYKKV
jgi:hypothetical protein